MKKSFKTFLATGLLLGGALCVCKGARQADALSSIDFEDLQDTIISSTTYAYIGGEKEIYQKETIERDANRHPTFVKQEHYDAHEKKWVQSTLLYLTYDSKGNNTSIELKDEYEGVVLPSIKVEWTYDGNGNQTSETHYQYNNTTEAYRPNYKQTRSFNSQNQMIERKEFGWNGTTNEFKLNSTDTYSYNSAGNLEYRTSLEEYYYVKVFFNYDSQGRLSLETFKKSTDPSLTSDSDLTEYCKYEYTYDGDKTTTIKSTDNYGGGYKFSQKTVVEEREDYHSELTYTYDDGWEFDEGTQDITTRENGRIVKTAHYDKVGDDINEFEIKRETEYTHMEVPAGKEGKKGNKKGGMGAGGVIGIVLGSLVLIFAGLFAAWKFQLDKVAEEEIGKRSLKFLDKVFKKINEVIFKDNKLK